jgi:nucleoid DNA-binding protein
LNKTELIAKVAEEANMTKKDTERFVNGFIKVVEDALGPGRHGSYLRFWHVPCQGKAC